MRNILTASIGLAALAVLSACSGGGNATTSGTSTGAATTSGGTTTGGTTTGGLAAGAACTANAACTSGVCGVDGKGNCCSEKCSTGDSDCGATACDGTGACIYVDAGTICPSNTCSQGMFVPQACDGKGICAAEAAVACDAGFVCKGSQCLTSCTSILDCQPGFACNAGACVAPIAAGPCTEDDDCTSQHCGIGGGPGHCCSSTTACLAGAPCGALDCDATSGTCLFADAGTSCGSGSQTCSGETLTPASACDGQGSCSQPKTKDCTPYVCGGNACLAGCTDNTSCALNDFCDLTNGACCAGLGSGSTIAVDSVTGSDQTACCGLGSNQPCQTIAQAMQSIDAAQATNAIIKVTVSGAGGDWKPLGEVYPIVLGWGAELSAPGIYFFDPNGLAAEVIDIAPFSVHDVVGSATLVGTAAAPVNVGFDLAGDQSLDATAVQVETSQTAYLANANLNGSATNATTALDVAAGGSVVFGQDPTAGITGTVTIGNTLSKHPANGYNGIRCETGANGGCTITDAKLKTSSLIVEGQENFDIDAEDSATITLLSSPIVGLAPVGAGFGKCVSKPDVIGTAAGSGAAIVLHGSAEMTFNNGTVQCISGDGFSLKAAGPKALPSLTLDGTTIQNTERGIYAQAGTATIQNSTIQFNYTGVEQDSDAIHVATIDLADADAGMNTVICSSQKESVTTRLNPGVSVLNVSNLSLAADNVNWDTSGPDLFLCSDLTSCTCKSSSCTVSPGTDGMDAAYEVGTITNSNPGLSATVCDPPPPGCGTGPACTPPDTCCLSLGECLSPISGIVCPPGGG